MTPEVTKKYLTLAATMSCYDIDRRGVDVVSVRIMRIILKRLILRGTCVTCALCGQPIKHADQLSLDHIVPRSCGGSDYLHNMQPAHRKCNEQKGNAMNDADIIESCTESADSAQQIADRKKKRKDACKKYRNSKWIKPWQIDNQCNRG